MQKNAHKKQHFIPKAYLKNFSPNGTNIFVYNKRIPKEFRSTIEKICYYDYFYQIPKKYIEASQQEVHSQIFEKDFFSQSVENLFEVLLTKINNAAKDWDERTRKTSLLSNNEKEEFSNLLAIQYLRMPNIREKYGDAREKATDQIIKIIASGLGYKNGGDSLSYDKEYNSILHSQLYTSEKLISQITTQLLNKKWIFYFSPINDVYTSDNPILIKPHLPDQPFFLEGFAMKGSEIIFPIGNSVILSIIADEFCDPKLSLDTFNLISAKKLREYNCFQYIWANKEVYSYKDDFELIHLLKQTNENKEIFMKKSSIKVNGK
ncbi:MAG: DUF4238 domain-containing protein [Gillisia sp.]